MRALPEGLADGGDGIPVRGQRGLHRAGLEGPEDDVQWHGGVGVEEPQTAREDATEALDGHAPAAEYVMNSRRAQGECARPDLRVAKGQVKLIARRGLRPWRRLPRKVVIAAGSERWDRFAAREKGYVW